MSTVKADTILAASQPLDISLGASGDTVTVAADSINVNKVQDKGGNTLWDYSTGEFVSSNPAFASQSLKLLSTAESEGTNGIWFSSSLLTSTHDVYIFKFINYHPNSADQPIKFNVSTDNGSTWATKTSTFFKAYHKWTNDETNLNYLATWDLAQSTGTQGLTVGTGTAASENGSGELYLFNPTSTTYVKHWYSTSTTLYAADSQIVNIYTAGYVNTTSAVNTIKFEAANGTYAGTIKMYGLL